MEPGALSLLPPLVAIVVAMLTRNVVASLLLGIFVGATMLANGNPLTGFYTTFSDFVVPSIGNEDNATILVYCGLFGGLIAMLQRSGGARAMARAMAAKVRSRRGAQGATVGFGVVLFFDDYFNALTVGNVMRPLTDRFRISREKLAYLVDSTSAPISLLAPISTWVVFVMGLIGTQYAELGIEGQTYLAYLETIPYNFYAIAALALAILVAFSRLDFGPMATAERRAYATGQLMGPKASPPSASEITEMEPAEHTTPRMRSLVVPIAVLLIATPILFLVTGGYPQNDLLTAVSEAEGALSILIAALLAGIVSIIMGMVSRTFRFTEAMDIYLAGIKGMTLVYVILALAWSIGSVTEEVGTAAYIVSVVDGLGIDAIIYMLVFIVAGIVAFTTGTSYGTFAIMLPIAIPLVVALDLSTTPAIAAVFSGGVFGDHCSPISDTTILSSAGSSSDHIDHVRTQIPYALTAAGVSAVAFLLVGLTGSLWVAAPIGLVLLAVTMWLARRLWPSKSPTNHEMSASSIS